MQVLYERFGARDYRRIACNQPKRENRIKQENPIMITRRSAQNSSSNEYGENTSRHEAQIKYQNPKLLSGSASARPDSGDDGHDGARHDDEWSPLIGIYTPAKLVFTMETFEHDDVEEEALAEAKTRRKQCLDAKNSGLETRFRSNRDGGARVEYMREQASIW
ncbi:hypothetical protein YC2023_122436 [Brassica napus]